ncbi:CBS domain-containing protein [Fervidobacterium islandicum]|uniref:CBS domain-containing protein n=1 Tax=Fervidobacterium islandicum TaxID=2423 RepID=A0AAI8CMB8_FERIS|nr:CBS domain-containing protein [Fervidobacterium islandicum]AMW33051.1 CBS domain-containing protein [Fervidobacterium islandicum]
MKVITTHNNPDFDGFASCVGMKKLHPDFEIVISGVPMQNLKEYLRLYEDEFPYLTSDQIAKVEEGIEELIIVDTPGLERIGDEIKKKLRPDAKITIIDHHPDIRGSDSSENSTSTLGYGITKIFRQTGAAASIVTKMLREHGVKPNRIEATLLGIAIYEDTGNLLFSSTTLDDIDAVRYLFECGLEVEIVAEYVKFDLTIDQKLLLQNLLQNTQTYTIDNHIITITHAETEKFVGGLSAVVAKYWYAQEPETLIAVVRMGKKVFIVGRTKSPDVDIRGLMSEFGGGGHRQAASATLSMVAVEEVIHKVLNTLPKYISSGLKAKDIMSSPVRTALASETIEEVNKTMEITGHNGIPIVEGNKLVGIVTKKTIEKAINHGLGKRPVKSVMTSKLITAKTDTPVSTLKKLMIEHDVGRIPILDENNILVGIVTRSDIIRASQKQPVQTPQESEVSFNFKNVTDIIYERLDKRIVNLLRLIGIYGHELKMPVYVVGGFVRDLLLNIPNYDIDIVVEGNGIEFAKYVGKQLDAIVVPYEKFYTATLVFKDGFKIDIATARTEYYEKPGELPQVDVSTIKKDLYRRDFTINAMAIKLNPNEFGVLYDFFNCQRDLQEGIIRILHNLSFIEDPTRMIRAVRFETRYNFRIEEHTLDILKKNLEGKYLERVSGSRIRQEIEKILEEREPMKAIRRLAELGILKHIFPKTYYTPTMDEKLERVFKFLPSVKERYQNISDFYAISTVLLEFYDKETLDDMRNRYGYPKKFIESLKFTENMMMPLKSMIETRLNFSDIYKVIGKGNPYIFIHLSAYLEEDDQEYLITYIDAILNTKLEKVSGKYVIERFSLKSGPVINEILERLYAMKLDNPKLDEIQTVEKIAEQFLKNLEQAEISENQKT